ncbi:MAG: hypothetical protein ABEN55_20735 [Bradymonadaceae bacterium]
MQTTFREGVPGPAAAIMVIGLAAALAPLACNPFNQGQTCSPSCESTFACDRSTGVCRPEPLTSFDTPPPGRHLATTVVDGEVFLAAIAPDKRLLVAGRPDSDDYVVLDRLERAERRSVTVASDGDTPTVVWLAEGGRYRIATRREGDWRIADIAADGDYRGSRHVDLAIGDAGPRLVFRNRRKGGLSALIAGPDEPWSLQLIDDGTAVEDRSQCSTEAGDPNRTGVGFEPDAARLDGTLLVSYYDADCGDLRLARRDDASWNVNVIDTGDYNLDVGSGLRRSGDVGRHSALAADSNGNIAIAYQDVDRGRLLFARETVRGFDLQLVDPGIQNDLSSRKRKQLVGAFADVTFQRIDNADVPYIAYMNGSETRIRLAYRGNDGQWLHRRLQPDPPTGFYTALEAPSSGIVVLAEQLDPSGEGITSRLVRRQLEVP